jgi:hypothetical protein
MIECQAIITEIFSEGLYFAQFVTLGLLILMIQLAASWMRQK